MTEAEVRRRFLESVKGWSGSHANHRSLKERVEGALFSFLAMLDGDQVNQPAYIVAPDPWPSDKSYCCRRDQDWYPQNHRVDVACNISGSLHDEFSRMR
jgi:hypothetical protein